MIYIMLASQLIDLHSIAILRFCELIVVLIS